MSFWVNRSREMAKNFNLNRNSHHPIETLLYGGIRAILFSWPNKNLRYFDIIKEGMMSIQKHSWKIKYSN